MKDIYPIEDDSLEFSDEFGLAEVEIDKSGDLYDSADLIKDIEYRNNRPPADTTPVIPVMLFL